MAESLVVLFSYTAFSLENTIPIELESRFSFNMNYFENKAHTWNGMNFERFLRGFPCSPKSSPVISTRIVYFYEVILECNPLGNWKNHSLRDIKYSARFEVFRLRCLKIY